MRESNYTYPPQNRATLSITHLLYDRRALDTTSPLAILNNLTSLTYLTQTSPRIREILALDGGLERLIDILRESCFPRDYPLLPDLWGLNGPTTARVIDFDRQMQLRHSLAFQCVVNIGVRGSEHIRSRVVQAGALDLVAQILETWLKQKGMAIFAGSLGSQSAIDARAAGLQMRGDGDRQSQTHRTGRNDSSSTARANSISQFVSTLAGMRPTVRVQPANPQAEEHTGDTDVDMADIEGGDETTDAGSLGGPDENMDVDDQSQEPQAGPSTTPRAQQAILPMPMNIPSRAALIEREDPASTASSVASSLTVDEPATIPRATSDNNLAGAAVQAPRPAPLNLTAVRASNLAPDPMSNQSSPTGTPTRNENVEGTRARGRRGTIVGRPINVNLAVRNDRRRDVEGGSGTSDGGEDVDLPAAIVAAGIAAANAQAMETGGTVIPDEPGPPPNVEIVEGGAAGLMTEEPDADAMAAEQARLDLEAGAPPGQPGAAQTPRVPPVEGAPLDQATTDTQIIIANGAPRGFHDLGSYVGISTLLNPEGDQYSDDSILLALQLLAYLSKYPHVRTAFHHPRRPMHSTFYLGVDSVALPLPERPSVSETPNIFSLVERFTFRKSQADPHVPDLPPEIQYWAGVIMRNACRKDEARGGIRQCANMMCGRWEKVPREFAKCRRCRKAKYCSKECQSRAWSDGHRFWCNSRSEDGPADGEGGSTSRRGNGGGAEEDDEDIGDGEIPADILIRAANLMGGQNGTENPLHTFNEAAGGGAPAPGSRGRTGMPNRREENNTQLSRDDIGQMALLEESLAGTRAARPDREARTRQRMMEGNAPGAPLLSPGVISEPPIPRTRQTPHDPARGTIRSPFNAPLNMETPSAPRLSHRVPDRADPFEHQAGAGSSPAPSVPSRFLSGITSPTPRTNSAGPSRLIPEWGRQPWFSNGTVQGGNDRQQPSGSRQVGR